MKNFIFILAIHLTGFPFFTYSQINIKSKAQAPTKYSGIFDADGISNAIKSRANLANASTENIQDEINTVTDNLSPLKYSNKEKYDVINFGLNSFIEFLNTSRLDISNTRNKGYIDKVLLEFNTLIDKAYNNQPFRCPFWTNDV